MLARCHGVRVIRSYISAVFGIRLNGEGTRVADSKNSDIVERRQRYIERQREMRPDTVNVRFQGAQPEGSGPRNRHGMPAVPVGQHLVKNWPVLDLGEQPDVPLEKWKLEIGGLVENPVTLNWEQFMALPQAEDISDFHCVTTWSRLGNHWKGRSEERRVGKECRYRWSPYH